jgi:NOL1/NOP2/fmu family ribosome biogenesis protein
MPLLGAAVLALALPRAMAAEYYVAYFGPVTVDTRPLAILQDPQSVTNLPGTTATFTVNAGGTAPLAYQWRKDALALADGGNMSGARSNVLTLANVQWTDAGQYTVVVSNAAGSATSRVANLTVAAPPQILTQPQSQAVLAGASMLLSVTVTGAPPISFQWRWNGTNLADGNRISGARTNSLTIANVQSQDAGLYTTVVRNPWGSVTSAPARLFYGEMTLYVSNQTPARFDFTNVDWVEIVLTAGFPNPMIFYTLDGSPPSPASDFYSDPLSLSNSVVVRAIAYSPVDFSSVTNAPAAVNLWTAFRLVATATVGGMVVLEPPGGFYVSNTVVNLTALPEVGWELLSWAEDAGGTSSNISLVMDRDKIVTAQFGRIPVFTLAVTTVGGGAVSGSTQSNYLRGTTVNLSAAPAPGWYFQSWSGDAVGTSRNVGVMMDRDKGVVARFAPLSLLAVTAGGGTIAVNPASNFVQDSNVLLTAQPQIGWTFLNWMGDASGTNPQASVTMDRPKEVQAVFGTACNTTVLGQGVVVRSFGTGLVPFGTVARLTALPQPGYYLGLWGNAASSVVNPLDFTVTNATPTVGALFVALGANQATLTVLEQGAGVVIREPQANAYKKGQTVRLTAQPFPGQTFLGWSGDASGTQNLLTVTVTTNQTITATFTHRLGLAIQPWPGPTQRRGFLLLLAGDEGNTCLVQTSPDLADWQPLTTLTISNTAVQFIDVAVTNHSPRFYRGVSR